MHGLAYAARLASAGLEGHSRPETLNLTAWIHALGLNNNNNLTNNNRVRQGAGDCDSNAVAFRCTRLVAERELSTFAAPIDW